MKRVLFVMRRDDASYEVTVYEYAIILFHSINI